MGSDRLPEAVIPRPRFIHSLAFRLIAGVSAVITATVPAFFVYQYRQDRRERLDAFQAYSRSVGNAILLGLEDGMLRSDFGTLNRMVATLGESKEVRKLLILSRGGTVKVSSDIGLVGRRYRLEEPGCVECHRENKGSAPRDLVLTVDSGERLFRTVLPILNRSACHRCHPADQPLNGILVTDLSMAGIDQEMRAAWWRVFRATGTTLALTVLLVALVLDRQVLRRLSRLRRVLEAAGPEKGLQPVESGGRDEIGILEEALNRMSGRVVDAMAQLKAQRRYLEDLVDSIEDEIMAIDGQGRVTMVNRPLAERLGKAKEDCLGRLCFDLLDCRHAADGSCPTLQSLASGRTERYLQRRTTREGREREMEVHSFLVRGEDSCPIQVVEVARDISHRFELEEQLHHAERLALVGQLASGVAHEINNPMAIIATCAEGLLARLADSKLPEPETFRDYLETIRRESFRCKSITTSLLEFARRKPPRFAIHDLGPVVTESLGMLEHRARSRGIRLLAILEPNLPRVRVDADSAKQVVVNLVLNAIDAVERGGEVRVRLRRSDSPSQLVLEVQDNGCGIHPENVARVFDPFFSTKAPGAGTGLGLSICQEIMRQLNGGIEVVSRVGEGSTFTARFPLPDSPGEVNA